MRILRNSKAFWSEMILWYFWCYWTTRSLGRNVGFKELAVTASCELTLGKQRLHHQWLVRERQFCPVMALSNNLSSFSCSKVLILDTWLEVLLNSNFCALLVIKKLFLHTIQIKDPTLCHLVHYAKSY